MSPGLLSLMIYARVDGLYDVGRGELDYLTGVTFWEARQEAAARRDGDETVYLIYEDGRGYEELAA